MHPRNKMRLLAGLTIDPQLERNPATVVTEAREVPRSRRQLAPKSPETAKKHAQGVAKAIMHLKNAVKALERIPATDFNGEIPYYIAQIEELLTSDDGEAGLESYAQSLQSQISEGVGDDVQLENEGMNAPQTRVQSDANFKVGEKVLYDNGIWLVHVSDAKADMVGIIPPGMKNASQSEKAKAMQQVKYDKIRKPSPEETKEMAGPDGIIGTADDNNPADRAVRESIMTNVMKKAMNTKRSTKHQATGSIAKLAADADKKRKKEKKVIVDEALDNMFKMKEVDINSTSSLCQAAKEADPESMKVPGKVKSALKATIDMFNSDANKINSAGATAQEKKQFMLDTAEAFQNVYDMLDGTSVGFKKAQTFAQSLMGPMIHKMPTEVWDFLAHSGEKRTLADFMKEVKVKK